MHRVILLIGGNEGNRLDNIEQAKFLIQKNIGELINTSGNYESEPWGFDHQLNFINQVIEIKTDLTPNEILSKGQNIEIQLGRKAKTQQGYEGRTMDIDILFYDSLILEESSLTIPHPRLHERKFTLLPLAEHWNDFVHPALNRTIGSLLFECKDEGWVRRL